MAKLVYILYDPRAINGDTDDALVLSCADTLHEAHRDARDFAPTYGQVAIYEYDMVDGAAMNERFVSAWPARANVRA